MDISFLSYATSRDVSLTQFAVASDGCRVRVDYRNDGVPEAVILDLHHVRRVRSYNTAMIWGDRYLKGPRVVISAPVLRMEMDETGRTVDTRYTTDLVHGAPDVATSELFVTSWKQAVAECGHSEPDVREGAMYLVQRMDDLWASMRGATVSEILVDGCVLELTFQGDLGKSEWRCVFNVRDIKGSQAARGSSYATVEVPTSQWKRTSAAGWRRGRNWQRERIVGSEQITGRTDTMPRLEIPANSYELAIDVTSALGTEAIECTRRSSTTVPGIVMPPAYSVSANSTPRVGDPQAGGRPERVESAATARGASAGPFRVVGVRADDTLVIRAGPDPRAARVGEIPANGTGVLWSGGVATYQGRTKSSDWYKIEYRGTVGWVNRLFLERE